MNKETPLGSNTLSILGYLIAVAGVIGLQYQGSLLARGSIGLSFQVIAVLLFIWARWTFGLRSFHAAATPTSGELVTNGPYRFLRHPIYAALIYFAWAGALTQPTIGAFGFTLLVTLGLALRILLEERLLVVAYPDYLQYTARTSRVIPFLL